MKSLKTSKVVVAVFLFVVCAAPVKAAILRLSDFSSEDVFPTWAEYLDARLNFSVSGNTLLLSVTNLTPENIGDPRFKINRIYFNVTDNVVLLNLIAVTGTENSATTGWNFGFHKDRFLVGGFGRFDASLVGGRGIHPPLVNPQQTVSFHFQITGAGPFSDNDFITLSSPVGGHILSYAAAKFYNDDTSAFGATNVPEPATFCLVLLGGLALLRKRYSSPFNYKGF